jgi:nicotinic acid mononucleotide adenylyltransferase
MNLKHTYYINYNKDNLNELYNWYKYYLYLKYNKCVICEKEFNIKKNNKIYKCNKCINYKIYNKNYLEFINNIKINYNNENIKNIVTFLMITNKKVCNNKYLLRFDNNILYLIINYYDYYHKLYNYIINDYNNLIKIDN